MKKKRKKRPSHIARARFGDIVAEFVPPKKRSNKVVIVCGGMPTLPRSARLGKFFSEKGYWFFAPRYRGSWESAGSFLKISPQEDIKDVMDGISRGFTNAFDKREVAIKNPKFYLFGVSFGGPAAVLNSKDLRVKKVICFSPVVDWRAPSKAESIDWMEEFIRVAFGEAYRFLYKDWIKLKAGVFYNPASHLKEIEGKKILIFHAKDDDIVGWAPVQKFAENTGARLILQPRGGHYSSSTIAKPLYWKKVKKFLA